MAHSVFEWLMGASAIVAIIVMWSPEVSSSCEKIGVPNGLINGQLKNDTHHAEIIHTFGKARIYGCLKVCKGTNGCTIVNYDGNATTCVLYSTTGALTFEASAGDWVLLKMQDTTFVSDQAACDPTNCDVGQYCRTFSGGPVCLTYA